MRLPRSVSLRSKFLLIVACGAVLPLAVLALWLNRTAESSGEKQLRARLTATLTEVVDGVGVKWLNRRSELLFLCDDPALQQALRISPLQPGPADSAAQRSLGQRFEGVQTTITSAELKDGSGAVRWTLAGVSDASTVRSGGLSDLPVHLPVYDLITGESLGTLDAEVTMEGILPAGTGWGGVAGSVLAVFDPFTGASLLPLSIDPILFEAERFQWGGESWLVRWQELREPPMQIVLAAPMTPFVEPFQEAARRNLLILAVVAATGFFLASLLTWRMTRNLNRLTTAAEAVARGDLDLTVEPVGQDEVGRLTRAFNTMTESLRQTLGELSQRQALAAVGEFASSMAHEVRNPLTSMKLNLQRIQERLPDDEGVQDPIRRALGQIERLDGTVSGALSIARSGRIELRPLDLRRPLTAALQSAEPSLQAVGVSAERPEPGPVPLMVKGDAGALEQLFLNLLLNAAEAQDERGRVGVTVERSGDYALVTVWDTGRGISSEHLDRVVDAFYSTKPKGTGLGLPIAHRIAVAHGGALEIESTPGVRTAVRIRIPLALETESLAKQTGPPT